MGWLFATLLGVALGAEPSARQWEIGVLGGVSTRTRAELVRYDRTQACRSRRAERALRAGASVGFRGGVLGAEVDVEGFGLQSAYCTPAVLVPQTTVAEAPGWRGVQGGLSTVLTPVRGVLFGQAEREAAALALGLRFGPRLASTVDEVTRSLDAPTVRQAQFVLGGGLLGELWLAERLGLRVEVGVDTWQEALSDERVWVARPGVLGSVRVRL